VSSIVWLASYPKSGNTWFRAFLANLLADGDDPVSINALATGSIASVRSLFDEDTGIDAADLTFDEIDSLRPLVYRRWAAGLGSEIGYHKIHDAYVLTAGGAPLVPADATRGALYFIRNPLDVAVSYSHHAGVSLDRAIGLMGDPAHCFGAGPRRLHKQLRQRMLTWSGHVESWVDQRDIAVHVCRYEDMHATATATFTAAAAFAGLPTDPARIAKALRFAAFDELRAQEDADGFQERAPGAEAFFRQGVVGSWRERLDAGQVERIISDHGPVMLRFGYLDERGVPVF
jgi:hypothetical protein